MIVIILKKDAHYFEHLFSIVSKTNNIRLSFFVIKFKIAKISWQKCEEGGVKSLRDFKINTKSKLRIIMKKQSRVLISLLCVCITVCLLIFGVYSVQILEFNATTFLNYIPLWVLLII